MKFDVDKAVQVLSSTPSTLRALLGSLGDEWTNGAPDASQKWEPFDVVGHLIHGEKTDWIPRAKIILAQGENGTFVPFDRLAQFEHSRSKTLDILIAEFEDLRKANIATLRSWDLTEAQLSLKGVHPELGEVDLRQLLATWVVHDLNHIRQIATALAMRYVDEVGPWREYLSVLN